MDKTIISNSPQDTQRIACNFGENFNGTFLALFGELGSGKTTFMQGFANGLGVKERIISPTFILIRQHRIKSKNFYHVDLYRVQKESEVGQLGLEEIFNDSKSIVAIEWAEKLKKIPEKRTEIHFENLGGEKRRLTFKTYE